MAARIQVRDGLGRQERHLDCEDYDWCLDSCVKSDWPGFTCMGCPSAPRDLRAKWQKERGVSQETKLAPTCNRPGCDKPAKLRADGRSMGRCEKHHLEDCQKRRGGGGEKTPAKGIPGDIETMKQRLDALEARQNTSAPAANGLEIVGRLLKEQSVALATAIAQEKQDIINAEALILVRLVAALGDAGAVPGWEEKGN